MHKDFRSRRREAEWMDRPDVGRADLERSLRFIRRINRLLGYTRATLHYLDLFSKTWPRDEIIRIADFATGSADIPRAILRWATNRGFQVQIVGIDLHPTTVQIARSLGPRDPRLSVIVGDALAAPFEDDSFDYALTAMFLHHLSDEQAVQVLREMNRVARRGIIAADLLRDRRAYWWITLFTVLSDPMVRHDGRVSVQQAFSREEVLDIRRRAGIEFAEYREHFAHRFVLAGQKNSAVSS
jgi:2-polyprenyl-3-methyl-5-hydroxy-6-metoxy-1,4-benzoquinol methylase